MTYARARVRIASRLLFIANFRERRIKIEARARDPPPGKCAGAADPRDLSAEFIIPRAADTESATVFPVSQIFTDLYRIKYARSEFFSIWSVTRRAKIARFPREIADYTNEIDFSA